MASSGSALAKWLDVRSFQQLHSTYRGRLHEAQNKHPHTASESYKFRTERFPLSIPPDHQPSGAGSKASSGNMHPSTILVIALSLAAKFGLALPVVNTAATEGTSGECYQSEQSATGQRLTGEASAVVAGTSTGDDYWNDGTHYAGLFDFIWDLAHHSRR